MSNLAAKAGFRKDMGTVDNIRISLFYYHKFSVS